jgi:WD40 repeat protein
LTISNYRSKRYGYCAVTSNYNKGIIAAAEYGLNPQVHIFNFQRQLELSFPMDTTVKCISMAFSRDGKYLIMVGGVPDFRITIFDTDSKKKLVMPETKLPCKPEEFLQVKFNPSDHNLFCILSQTTLYSFQIHQAYDYTEGEEDKVLLETFRLE